MADQELEDLSTLASLLTNDIIYVKRSPFGPGDDHRVPVSVLDTRFVGSEAPLSATYITQTPNATLTNEQALSALATGLVKNTTATGVLSIAAEGTDYYGPGGTDVALTDGGTGASTAGDARTNLGLGSIATQAANSVSITGGSITGITDLAIADGGTGQSTAQAAIDALTDAASATDEHVLTKDTASGNAIFKAAATTQPLPVTDTTSIVKGSADATKEIRFEVDGLTTSTVRVLTPQDADYTLAGLETAQTFTAAQTIDVSSTTALQVETGGNNTLVVDTTNGRIGIKRDDTYADISLGDVDLGAFGDFRGVGIGVSNANVEYRFGQAAGTNMILKWNYNATAASAFASFETFGNNNPFIFRGSFISMQDGAGNVTIGVNVAPASKLRVFSGNTGKVSIVAQGASGQTADLMQWQADTTAVLALVDAGGKPTFKPSDTASAAVTNVGTLGHNLSSGSPSAGIGTGLLFQVQMTAGVNQNLAAIKGVTTNVGSGTEATDITFETRTGGAALAEVVRFLGNGRVQVGPTAPAAKAHIDQNSTTAAIPVLYLNQADISEQMIEFNTTIGVGNAIEAIGAKTLTTTHFIKVTLPGGLTRYIPCGTIA